MPAPSSLYSADVPAHPPVSSTMDANRPGRAPPGPGWAPGWAGGTDSRAAGVPYSATCGVMCSGKSMRTALGELLHTASSACTRYVRIHLDPNLQPLTWPLSSTRTCGRQSQPEFSKGKQQCAVCCSVASKLRTGHPQHKREQSPTTAERQEAWPAYLIIVNDGVQPVAKQGTGSRLYQLHHCAKQQAITLEADELVCEPGD